MEKKIMKAKKLLEDNQDIIEKGESIFRDFHGKLQNHDRWDGDQDNCIHCNKPLHIHSIEIDLDEKDRSSYHPEFDGVSVTGFVAVGNWCLKSLGLWKDVKAYTDLMKKYWKLNKEAQ